ncbi:MAG: UvrD-helicase domain-containing protein, partial [bacterium]|nr:UvrD-helicase domain-containing protein [bacterium]
MKLDYLNENQIKAIKHKDGPMLVLAGAGSGKTSVLTKRVAYLIESGVNPYNILAITFTNKAALEMKERILSILGNTARQIQISTFHSLGLKIIKENIEYLIYDKNFVILDSDDTLTLLKKIIKNMNLDTKIYIPRVVRSKISNVKNELMSIDEFKKIEFDDNIIKIYKEYINTLVNNNSVDFDDLLILPIKLFKENPNILMKYQERFKYLLIDEYQDTNEAQYILTKMLSAKYKNIFVVGDADQSIYA